MGGEDWNLQIPQQLEREFHEDLLEQIIRNVMVAAQENIILID